jgi:hypothetical protein
VDAAIKMLWLQPTEPFTLVAVTGDIGVLIKRAF